MIVFDLRCGEGHVFEAWFASSAAFEAQNAAGQLACPICGDGSIAKAVMAPAIAVGARSDAASIDPAAAKAMLKKLSDAQAKALSGSKWVGEAFAERARTMHAGEERQAPIHGRATVQDARSMFEEGVPIAPLPLPVKPPERTN